MEESRIHGEEKEACNAAVEGTISSCVMAVLSGSCPFAKSCYLRRTTEYIFFALRDPFFSLPKSYSISISISISISNTNNNHNNHNNSSADTV
jgi:hypothetical protein